MSDTKSENKELILLIETMSNKINNSPVLNGGFDRLVNLVDRIKEKQEETTKTVENLETELLNPIIPDKNIFTKIKDIETKLNNLHFAKHETETKIVKFEKDISYIQEISEENKNFQEKVKTVAGSDLESLKSIVGTKKTISEGWLKALWLIFGGLLAAFGKSLWDYVIKK